MKRVVRTAFFAAVALPLAACSDMDDSWLGGKRANLTAQYPVVDVNFERIDLIAALAGDAVETRRIRIAAAQTQAPPARDTAFPTGPSEVRVASIELSMAYQAFYTRTAALPEPARRLERNRIQDQVFSSSQLACSVFKRNLRIQESRVGFLSGAATTVLGGLGAIFTSASTARALAGSAGITSGIGAEFRQAHFANLAAEVITTGIDAKRASIYDQIDTRRHHTTNGALSAYSMENAIHDTIRYHAACSIDAGFEAAKDAIQLTRNPGLNELDNVINRFNAVRNRLRNPESSEERQSGTGGESLRLSSLGGAALDFEVGDLPLQTLSSFRQQGLSQTQRLYRTIEGRLDELSLLEDYKDTVGQKALAEKLAPLAGTLANACTRMRVLADEMLAIDKAKGFSSDIAARIAQLDGDSAKLIVDEALRKLNWQADAELIQSAIKAQTLWDIRAARLRGELLKAPDTRRADAAAAEAKAMNDEVGELLKPVLTAAKKDLASVANDAACKVAEDSTLGKLIARATPSAVQPPPAPQPPVIQAPAPPPPPPATTPAG